MIRCNDIESNNCFKHTPLTRSIPQCSARCSLSECCAIADNVVARADSTSCHGNMSCDLGSSGLSLLRSNGNT